MYASNFLIRKAGSLLRRFLALWLIEHTRGCIPPVPTSQGGANVSKQLAFFASFCCDCHLLVFELRVVANEFGGAVLNA